MPELASAATRRLSKADAERAVYFDFEGTATDPPSLLGLLYDRGGADGLRFEQYIVEDALRSCISAARPKLAAEYRVASLDMAQALDRLWALSADGERKLVAWSSYEAVTIRNYCQSTDLAEKLLARIVDLKPQAKRWKWTAHPEIQFPRRPRGGAHTLHSYLELISYDVPKPFGPLLTGARIRYVREQLSRRGGDYCALTATAKGKWTRMVIHNWHDCNGLRTVAKVVS